MIEFIKNTSAKVIDYGTEFSESQIDKKRLQFFNSIILISILASLASGISLIIFGFFKVSIISWVSLTAYLPFFLLNKKGYTETSKTLFFLFSSAIITYGSISNTHSLISVESENLFYILLVVTLFLIKGLKKHILFWAFFTLMICVKIYIDHSEYPTPYLIPYLKLQSRDIYVIVNNFVVAIILYISTNALISLLTGTLEKSKTQDNIIDVLLDNIPINISLMDTNNSYKLVNRKYADKYGLKKKDIIGRKREDVLPVKVLKDHQSMMNRAFRGENITIIEKSTSTDGSEKSARCKFIPVRNDSGIVKYIAICIDDVSELIKAHEDLQAANETKDKIFSIIAHDIRSPLNLFQSILNISKDGLITQEEFIEYQNTVKQKLGSVTTTIDSLLEWARMQLGGINAYPTTFDVNAVAQENKELFLSLIEQKNIDFKISGDDNTTAWMDENHLKVIVRNLVHNALKFTPSGKSVAIEIEDGNPSVLIRIKDEGVGMPPESISAILTKQVQKSKVGTEQEKGTGLGLSLSIGLLERNHCSISIDSEEGKGTVFEISIPKEKPAEN